jgi:hypothetical protein
MEAAAALIIIFQQTLQVLVQACCCRGGWAYLGFQTSQLVPVKQSEEEEALQQQDCLYLHPSLQACQVVPPQFIMTG